MTDIALSLAARGSILSLQATAEMQARTSARLATGLKVNTALDDPTAFFTARGLDARAGDIERLADGIGIAKDTINAADNGLKAIKRLIEQARAALDDSIKAGAGDGLNVDASIESYRNQADIRNRVVDPSASNGVRLTLSVGKEASTTFINGAGNDGTTYEDVYDHFLAAFQSGGSPIEPYWVDNTPGSVAEGGDGIQNYNSIGFRAQGEAVIFATTDDYSANNVVTGLGLYRGPNYTGDAGEGHAITGWVEGLSRDDVLTDPPLNAFFTDTRWYSDLVDHGNGGLSYVRIRAVTGAPGVTQAGPNVDVRANTLGDLIDGVNQANALGRFDFRAQLNDDGQFQLVSTSDEARLRLPAGGIQHHALGLGWGDGDVVPAMTRTDAGVPAFDRFEAIIDQLDETAADSGFNGRNLLADDILSVNLNETGGALSLTGREISLESLGLDDIVEADFVSLRTMEVVSRRLDEAEALIEAAASRLSNSIGAIGIRETFNAALAGVLRSGSAALVLADANEEGANMLATDTRMQLASNALSLATQADRSVLRLF